MGGLHTLISRRTALRSLAGMAGLAGVAAISGGLFRLFSPKRAIPGQLFGPNAALGHRLRSGNFPAATDVRRTGIAIVGGGITGLSAARWLSQQGYNNYTLLELENTLGGNSTSGANQVSACPWGAHYLPIPNADFPELYTFLQECGVITGFDNSGKPIFEERYLCTEPEERLLLHGYWQDGLVPRIGTDPENLRQTDSFFRQIETFRHLKGTDGRYAFSIPLGTSSADSAIHALDNLSFQDWLQQQGYTASPLLWYLNYCCRDDYGSTLAQTSAWAGIHYHAARRGTAANADPDTVLTWPQGNAWLVDQLRSACKGQLITGHLVSSVEQAATGAQLQVFDSHSNTSYTLQADAVLLAVPAHVAARLSPGLLPDGFPSSLHHAPWLVANVTAAALPGANGEPLSWDNVSYTSPSLGYVVATHQAIQRYPGPQVLTYYLPITHLPPAEASKWAYAQQYPDWQKSVLADLETMHPGISASITQLDCWLWGHGMVAPTTGYLWGAQRQELLQQQGPIQWAHTDLAGISIFEEAFAQGILAAKRLHSVYA